MACAPFVALLAAVHAATPLPGDNVNMVSGRSWPGGDPFGQRQNEPSIAVSSVNPAHLLAGANDYRTVDLTLATVSDETSDAWLSLFESRDGGATWQSYLHPGFPQLTSAANQASPLFGLGAASDPVVRAGTNGLFFYSGIAFNRGTNVGKVFVSRLIDLNNQESGDATAGNDPVKFIDTHVIDTGTSGQFQDKPWVATDIPRKGASTCSIGVAGSTVTFPAGNAYFAYATFTGAQQSSSKVYFTRSLDCGQTWATPQKLSESNALNQGTTIAVDPTNGNVWVFWRRFAVPNQGDAIMMARSTNAGSTFTKATVLVDLSSTTAPPFDQPGTGTSFRSDVFPTAAISVDAAGKSYVHLAWAQRLASATGTGDARIFITTFDGSSWSTPQPADPGPFRDDDSSYLFSRGHQLMPALTFSQGRLVLLYYDSRLDHGRRYYQPNPNFLADGRLFTEWLAPVGAALTGGALLDDLDAAPIFAPFIDDATLADTRHTLDVRVAEFAPGAFAPGTPIPAAASARVTNFPFGIRSDAPAATTLFDGTVLPVLLQGGTTPQAVAAYQQVQANPPNLPMFSQGKLPFLGDYIDVQGPAFTRAGAGWKFNTDPVPFPVFHAVWTSNQDVRGPPPGTNPATGKPYAWTDYTPPGSIALQPDGSFLATPNPACNPALSGMRDQNIYTSRITEGLLVSSPQNVKSLDVPRAFVVQAQNTTSGELVVTLCLPGSGCAGAPPALSNVDASFQNLALATRTPSVTFHVAPHATVYRSVFARVTTGTAFYTAIPVAWSESTTGLSGTITLNPTAANFSLVDINGATVASEVYLSSISNAQVTSAQVTSAQVTSAQVTSAQVTSAQVTSANVTSAQVTSAQVTSAQVTSAQVTSAQVTSANVTSGNVTSGNVTSGNVTSASLPESDYTVTNTGNTTHSYHVKLLGPTASPTSGLQLILYGTYFTQAVDPFSCGVLDDVPHTTVTAVIDNPPIFAAGGPALTDPNIPDDAVTNATFVLAPGETKQITVRGLATTDVTTTVPAVVPHAGGSIAVPADFTTTTVTSSASPSRFGQSVVVTASVAAPGGGATQPTGAVTFYDGCTATTSGVQAGTPLAGPVALASGTATFSSSGLAVGTHPLCAVFTSADANFLSSASPVFAQVVARADTATALAPLVTAAALGAPVSFTATVTVVAPGAGTPAAGATVTFYDGCTSSGGAVVPGTLALAGTVTAVGNASTLVTSALGLGTHAVCAVFAPAPTDPRFNGSTSNIVSATITAGTATTLTSAAASPTLFGAPITFTATVAGTSGAPAPVAGSVGFFDGCTSSNGAVTPGTLLGTGALPNASITLATLAAGPHALCAVFAGGGGYDPSTSGILPWSVTVPSVDVAVAVTSSANPATVGQTYTLTATVTVAAPGVTPTGTVAFFDGGFDATPAGVTVAWVPRSPAGWTGTAVLTISPALAVALDPAASLLQVGTHAVTAQYGGDAVYAGGTSPVLSQAVVLIGTSTAATSTPNPSSFGQAVTFTATVTPAVSGSGTPTGTITWFDGCTSTSGGVLAGPTVLGTGSSLVTSALTAGQHPVCAVYSGDATFSGSTSPVLTQSVNGWTFTGFITPLKTANALVPPSYSVTSSSGSQNFGSAVPVKWQLQRGTTFLTDPAATVQSLVAYFNPNAPANCTGPVPGTPPWPPPASTTSYLLFPLTAGNSTFRYDTTNNQFIINWDTTTVASRGCYDIVLTLRDGSPPRATALRLK